MSAIAISGRWAATSSVTTTPERTTIMDEHATRAGEIYSQNYNCAQAVLCAFGEQTGLTDDAAKRLASSFGGGIVP